jgi:hypothetical protein
MKKSDSEARWSDRFEWNIQKRLTNIEKHRIDFRQAIAAFDDPQSIEYVSRGNHDEHRCVLVGLVSDRLIAVIYVVRSAKIRIISARAARPEERKLWNANTS